MPRRVLIEHRGRRMCIREWADWAGMNTSTLEMRLHRGWKPEHAIGVPVRKRGASKHKR